MRSFLFVPGSSERMLRRALAEPVDAVIADLEDGVAPPEKDEARRVVAAILGEPRSGGAARLVRVNRDGAGLLADDLRAIAGLELDGVVVPKAEPGLRLDLPEMPVVAIVETPAGVAGVQEVCALPRVERLMLGVVDLGLSLRLRPLPDEAELAFFRSTLVLHSALAGLAPPIDGVFVDVPDLEGLRASAERGRAFGMGAKACVHPAQVAVVNEVFATDSAEVDEARRVVEAYDAAASAGSGAVALDGRMIDKPVVEQARRLLAEAEGPAL
jgi:citrate lyase subunit beta/citryl-CoA lyase